jgi:hypothetical protein
LIFESDHGYRQIDQPSRGEIGETHRKEIEASDSRYDIDLGDSFIHLVLDCIQAHFQHLEISVQRIIGSRNGEKLEGFFLFSLDLGKL